MTGLAVVTGSRSGIGLATLKGLQADGWNTVGLSRTHETDGDGITCDLRSEAACESAAEQIAKLAGDKIISVFFANAGYAIPGLIEDVPRDAWREQFEANLFGHIQIINYLLDRGLLRKGSKLIWCSSVLGYSSLAMRGPYAASKYAMEAIADTQRIELASRGIQVVLIEPGPVATNFKLRALWMLDRFGFDKGSKHPSCYEALRQRLKSHGSSKLASAEDVGKLVRAIVQKPKPKERYRVTLSAKATAVAKRIFPTSVVDSLCRKASGSECP